MILVCGLSKCGKTSLIRAATAAGLTLRSVRASHLLRSSGLPTIGLTSLQALNNQFELKNIITRDIADNRPFVLDGHLLIETVDGPQLVPESAIAPIGLLGAIAVTASPEIISTRRAATPFTTNLSEISDFAAMEIAHAKRLSRHTRTLFFQIDHEDTEAFLRSVSEILKTVAARNR